MAAIETSEIESWLSSALLADGGPGGLATLVNNRIFAFNAPQNAAKPYVIYNYLRAEIAQGTETRRTAVKALYQVEIVGQPKNDAQWDTMLAAEGRIDAVVGHALNAAHNGYVFNGYMAQPISRPEINPQTQERIIHKGGEFWVEASASS